VARITLDRPEVRNALSRTMLAELEAALAAARRSVRAPTSRAWATAAPR
jgi:enoyl-CoA hydratase/carnithine racemase